MATKKTAGRAPKTDALSVRIDPRLRYGLELLSRQQRRSVTGVVEWAIDRALRAELADGDSAGDFASSFAEAVTQLWSPNEVERLVNLATMYPHLMTYEEVKMWEVMKNSPNLWVGKDRRPADLDPQCLENWDALGPLIVAASERSVVIGLSKQELETKAGIIPF